MPRLTKVDLPLGFMNYYKEDIAIKKSTYVAALSQAGIGALARHPFLPKRNPRANIHSLKDYASLSTTVETFITSDVSMNHSSLTVLNLSRFPNLTCVQIGDNCFKYVGEVKIIGLKKLTSVVVGRNSFNQYKEEEPQNRHFYLKDCPALTTLKIGIWSFHDYDVCEIERVDALESITIGKLEKISTNFNQASLELSSTVTDACVMG